MTKRRYDPAVEIAAASVAAWRKTARPNQLPLDGDWATWMALAGRGFGKTRAGGEWTFGQALRYPGSRTALVAPTQFDLRRVCLEGVSGLTKIIPDACYWGGSMATGYNKSLYEIKLFNGSMILGYSAEKPDRLRGPEHHFFWGDEVAAWHCAEDVWDMLQMTMRLGEHPRGVVTTTPRPRKFIRNLKADPTTKVISGSTFDNAANLPAKFLQRLRDKYDGTRLGRQELYAEILEDIPGALWSRQVIDRAQMIQPGDLQRIVVAVDPAVSNTDGSDEHGIIVCTQGKGGAFGVLADYSLKGSPNEWAEAALRAYRDHGADRIVAEKNQGGDMVEHTIRTASLGGENPLRGENVPVTLVHASRGKVARAEPIAALYEQGRVAHAAGLSDLEDQMCLVTTSFDRTKAGFSPDRVDALVWGLSFLSGQMNGEMIIDYWSDTDPDQTATLAGVAVDNPYDFSDLYTDF